MSFFLLLFFSFMNNHVTRSSVLDELKHIAVFPPVVPEVDDGQPRGHLKPFGWQRPPEGPVKEYAQALGAHEFWHLHAKPKIPLVYREYVKSSPAVQHWTDEYLANKYGNLDILVEHKSEDRSSSSGRMLLSDFLKHYNDSDMYVVSMFPSEMMPDVRAISSILCGTFRNYTHESNFWMSSGGTRSVIHYDADHNFHCVLAGRKDFMMVNNNITTKTNLYYRKKDAASGSGFSFLDPDSINMRKFKRIANVAWTYASLFPGDCIFIPAQYIHQVRGYGRTVAVTTLFTADVADNFNGDDCKDDLVSTYHTMAEVPFQWTYKKGDATIDMGYMNVELVKERYRDVLTDTDFAVNGSISKKTFILLAGLIGPLGRNKTKVAHIWKNVFGFSNDYRFNATSIETITLEQWKTFCRAIEPPHGVVTNGSEPVFVQPGERHKWEEEHPEEDDLKYFTEREMQLKEASTHDPMLDHLTKEERREYLKQMKEKKAKYGIDFQIREDVGMDDDDDDDDDNEDDDDDDNDNEDEVLDTSNWASEVTWSLSEISARYRQEMFSGKIPLDFKDDFMDSLSDVIKEKFKNEFANNIMPKDLLRELNSNVFDLQELKYPHSFWTAEISKQKQLIRGKVPLDDIDLFVEEFPEHKDTLRKGIIPDVLLRMIIGYTDDDEFRDDIDKLKARFSEKKHDEL